ncbi:AMP-binding protein [Sporosarcina sp. JAI121]|uniref:AMP-binding protein n=1 Tax=Sporosarcina sp. JAI121 TaxID=2723064 RepID=UPI00184860E8|nr:long-chain acyl-CoA synthetase [Sporosarcina sp. JAI121]
MPTITSTYQQQVRSTPDKIAIQTASEAITYCEWHTVVCKTANWIHSTTGTSDTIGIFMPNSIAFLQLFTGTAMAGRVAATFDAKWKPAELEQRLTISSPSVLITTAELADRITGTAYTIIIWEEALRQIQQCHSSWTGDISGEMPFYMGFTSGTTGVPKAFIRSHNSWIASFECSRHDFHIDKTDHVLIPGALIHSHFLYGAISVLYLGGTIYLLDTFSPLLALNFIKNYQITILYVVPTMIEAMLLEDVIIDKPVQIISSGAKWEEDSKRKIQEQFLHVKMFEFYGASELSFVSFLCNDSDRDKPGSVGKPFHNVEIQIRHAHLDEASAQEIGTIFVRSQMVFDGYIHPQSHTIQSIKDNEDWVTVNDIGYLDEDGYLYIVGREKNMILYGGVNVYPEEIETVLLRHPDVEEATVVGISDLYWGQIPVAVIKGHASKKELKKHCMDNLSSYKLPRKWFFVEEMPHTTSGKIARMHVQQLVETEVVRN